MTTTWQLGDDLRTTSEAATDLLTPRAARLLEHAALEHERLAAETRSRHAEEQARPRGRRVIPPGSPTPDLGDPPF